ncbi:rod shape-determining protein RodA [soil metagenome]
MWSRFKTFDPFLILLPIGLGVVSCIFIYILTLESGGALALRQAEFSIAGAVLMIAASVVDYRALKAWRIWLYIGLVLFLVAVIFFGTEVFGAKSWIDIGPFQFQPGEIGKLAIIVFMAGTLQTKAKVVGRSAFLTAMLLSLIPIAMVLIQPDLGTAMITAVIVFVVGLHAKLSKMQRTTLIMGLVISVGIIVGSFRNIGPLGGVLKDYQKARLTSFIDPNADPGKSGYNVLQSKITVGSGGLTGQGLGFGSQSQLNFLPVVHADFIFAAIAEAWGLVGSYGIIAAFIFLILRVLNAARISGDEFGSLVAVGIATMLLFQVLVNIGMNIGIMPVTGIPLPFLSYGGTAVITYFLGMGIVQSVVIQSKRLTF